MKRFTILTVFLIACLGAFGDILWNISQDIHAIREMLEPKPITFGAEPPPFRARVDFRENSYTGVTLL